MTANRIAVRGTSLVDTAKMFSEGGVDIVDCYEGELGPVHMIRFHGDDEAGFKAVEVAKEIGLKPSQLYRVWPVQFYDDQSHWELTFFYDDLVDQLL